MSYTYILYSAQLGKFYTGACKEDILQRLEDHNTGKYGSKSYTSVVKDWEFRIIFCCRDFSHAIRLERKVKSMKSKVYIENLMKYEEMCIKIISQTEV